jgi:hypothetical protein
MIFMKLRGCSLLEAFVSCQRCESLQLRKFTAEINMHFPGYEGLAKPSVWVFPQVLVCLDCGLAQFPIPQLELERLAADDANVVRPQAA